MRARGARRSAVKWLAAPRAGPRKKIGPIKRRAFSSPEKIDASGIGRPRVACCMGCMVRWGVYRPPPSVPTKIVPLQGTPPAYPAIREPEHLPLLGMRMHTRTCARAPTPAGRGLDFYQGRLEGRATKATDVHRYRRNAHVVLGGC